MLSLLKEDIVKLVYPLIEEDLKSLKIVLENTLELPKDVEHGHVSLPVFFLAKTRRMAPTLIAENLSQKLTSIKPEHIQKIMAVGGYINFHFDNFYLQKILHQSLQGNLKTLGHSNRFQGQKVVIDYSSPNVAKPMHVGHFRATVVGQAIANLANTQGYEVCGLNHLGDWGVQFG